MNFKWNICYEVITPESAEDGDVADRGFEAEDCTGTLYELVSDIERYGCCYTEGARWFYSEGTVDYRDGSTTSYTIHPVGLSERNFKRIARLVQ